MPLVIPIEGMTASLDATQNGYVVFTETLQKDRLFFEWLQVDLMGQWIKQMQVTRADQKQAFVLEQLASIPPPASEQSPGISTWI